MPELPEVETVCRGLRPALVGKRIARVRVMRPDLRWPLPAGLGQALTGRRVEAVDRRAKYILVRLDDANLMLAHLGMTGSMRVRPVDPTRALLPHDHVILETEDGISVTFHDPRRFGMIDLVPAAEMARHKLLAELGPEPLEDAFNAAALSAALAGKRTPIKAALLDQTVVAGLGNIYVCEALYRAGIGPRRLAQSVGGARAERLVTAIKSVLQAAIESGGSTLRDYVQADGELGYFQHRFEVYDREGQACLRCGNAHEIRRIVQSGRSTFYCGRCQR
ncbi:bifunctional DNA-formamidopyrimidine glycosylase/DNA-(apurinic or apyrimidinic site) lyase [Desertibaculum subflavum]|uniref:bifunctional DNA-formamidopyrimidine glycosylase/DNA-(apurinic or apyrimidinic site) lyase n=1 Tax=Desertibaculum subflavum TaxID=2268458 RepID=UPI000E668468